MNQPLLFSLRIFNKNEALLPNANLKNLKNDINPENKLRKDNRIKPQMSKT
jgi:hypothetical protein